MHFLVIAIKVASVFKNTSKFFNFFLVLLLIFFLFQTVLYLLLVAKSLNISSSTES